jgi:hypothetical protein
MRTAENSLTHPRAPSVALSSQLRLGAPRTERVFEYRTCSRRQPTPSSPVPGDWPIARHKCVLRCTKGESLADQRDCRRGFADVVPQVRDQACEAFTSMSTDGSGRTPGAAR